MYINILTHICKNDSPLAADRVMNTHLQHGNGYKQGLIRLWTPVLIPRNVSLDLQLCMLISYSFFNVKLVDSLKPITSLRFDC